MNKAIFNKIPYEFQLLWQASKVKKLEDSALRDSLKNRIRRARIDFRDQQKMDILEGKLTNFGNGGGWGLEKLNELARMIFQDKKPANTDLGQWISVELELVMQTEEAESQFVQFVRGKGWKNAVTIKDDGSIKLRRCECEEEYDEETDENVIVHEQDCQVDARTAYGREIVLTFRYGDWEFVKEICKMLNKLGCSVNKTCGMHVHFDMRHMENKRKMGIVAHRLAKVVPALKQMLPPSRSNNRFCNQVINAHDDQAGGDARYAFINMKAWDRHKTLEIRGHSGTTDARKIVNWINILKVVMEKPNRKDINTVDEMIKRFKFEPELQEYMVKRQVKFAAKKLEADDVSSDNSDAVSETENLIALSPQGQSSDRLLAALTAAEQTVMGRLSPGDARAVNTAGSLNQWSAIDDALMDQMETEMAAQDDGENVA